MTDADEHDKMSDMQRQASNVTRDAQEDLDNAEREYQEMEAMSGVDNLRSDVAQAEDQLQDAKQELERLENANASAEELPNNNKLLMKHKLI